MANYYLNRLRSGFTLVELMVVIGILILLLSIAVIAINPARQFGKANDTRRLSDVNQISNAIYQNIAENRGDFIVGSSPFTLPLTPAVVASGGTADICAGLTPKYLPALPQDPASNNGVQITSCTSYTTGYRVSRATDGRITVDAPSATSGTVTVTR